MPIRIAAAIAVLVATSSCSTSTPQRTKTPDLESAPPTPRQERRPEQAEKQSTASGWSEVQPFSAESEPAGTNKRRARVVASSDPNKHGHSLHFRFLVNGTPISGVFVVPGGQTATFSIPVGTVHFSVDECAWDPQGFDLAPDEEMPISCKLGKEGDCCEVAIPDDESSQPSKAVKKQSTSKTSAKRTDPED
ncbi:MAG TPA: hypothetical protein VKP30_21680 [Polyangiaceae bacterium]|nr:hypothetical protein [Polyangiaceae bacterium]